MSKGDYTPSDAEVIANYSERGGGAPGEIRRWLAEHDAKVRAEEREKAAQVAEEFDPVEAALAGRYAGKDIAARIREQDTREPSDAEVRAGAFAIDEGAMDSPADYPLQAEAAMSLARDVLLAAQEVRRG